MANMVIFSELRHYNLTPDLQETPISKAGKLLFNRLIVKSFICWFFLCEGLGPEELEARSWKLEGREGKMALGTWQIFLQKAKSQRPKAEK